LVKPGAESESVDLAGARARVADAVRSLAAGSAAGLIEAAGHLEAAVDSFGRLQSVLANTEPARRGSAAFELASLRRDLGRVTALMASAFDFHAGLVRMSATKGPAYGPDGAELGLPSYSGRGSRCETAG
jgi:hypothetical protein